MYKTRGISRLRIITAVKSGVNNTAFIRNQFQVGIGAPSAEGGVFRCIVIAHRSAHALATIVFLYGVRCTKVISYGGSENLALPFILLLTSKRDWIKVVNCGLSTTILKLKYDSV